MNNGGNLPALMSPPYPPPRENWEHVLKSYHKPTKSMVFVVWEGLVNSASSR